MELLDIERSIITKYRKTIWSKFVKAIQEYELIEENAKKLGVPIEIFEMVMKF